MTKVNASLASQSSKRPADQLADSSKIPPKKQKTLSYAELTGADQNWPDVPRSSSRVHQATNSAPQQNRLLALAAQTAQQNQAIEQPSGPVSGASSSSEDLGLQALLSAIDNVPKSAVADGDAVLKSLLFLYPGGTIGCIGKPLAPMSGKDFEAAMRKIVLPIVKNEYPGLDNVGFHAFDPPIDSTNAQPKHWCDIADVILQNYRQYEGFVVLHGTDTMAWSASVLPFLLSGLNKDGLPLMPLSKPVVVTGSQAPLFAEGEHGQLALKFGTDALVNLCGSIQSCDQLKAGLIAMQVGLYFARHLMRGNRATKIDTDGFSAFGSPNHPNLAESSIHSPPASNSSAPVREDAEALQAVLEQNQAVRKHFASGNHSVAIFPAFPAEPGLIADLVKPFLHHPKVKGCIFEGYGAGNFPAEVELKEMLTQAHHEQKKILVAGTQVVGGRVNTETYAAGSWLKNCGVIGAVDMTTPAAHAKLSWLLALNEVLDRPWGQQKIEEHFQRSMAGELTPAGESSR